MAENSKKCPKCGRNMVEVESDPIFKKTEYICPFCKMMEIAQAKKHEQKYLATDKLIVEEIKRLFNSKISLKDNHELFNKKSKIKFTFDKYSKIIHKEANKLREKIRKK